MISISDKTAPISINIPRNTAQVYENYTLKLSRGNKDYTIVPTDIIERNDYRTMVVDVSSMPDGEYEYSLNSGEIGIIRIGAINKTNTKYTANEQYQFYKG